MPQLPSGSTATARHLPEWCLWNTFSPEDLPSRDGPSVGAEEAGKLADSARRGPLPHGAHQDDHGAEVHLWAEKTHGRWCDPLAAAVAIATEAEPLAVRLG